MGIIDFFKSSENKFLKHDNDYLRNKVKDLQEENERLIKKVDELTRQQKNSFDVIENLKKKLNTVNTFISNKKIEQENLDISNFKKKYSYENVNVCIIREEDHSFIKNLRIGQKVYLVQEPNNTYDNKAVKLMCDGLKIGYLYRGKLQDMANDYINRHDLVIAEISNIDYNNKKIQIKLEFYKSKLNCEKFITEFSVTISEKKFDDNCYSIFEGAEVPFEYDDDKEKYLLDDWGYAPKSVNGILDILSSNLEDDFVLKINEVEQKDNGSYKITINVIKISP